MKTGDNRTTWLRDDGSFSSKPAASPDWKGEVAQNIRGSGSGFANPEHDAKQASQGLPSQEKAREAFAMRPSPNNFSGGPGMGAGFGPGDPRNTDHYWKAVAKAPGERAEAVRHNALAQEAAARFPYGPQENTRIPELRASSSRRPHEDPNWMRSFGERKAAIREQRSAADPGGLQPGANAVSSWGAYSPEVQAMELELEKMGSQHRQDGYKNQIELNQMKLDNYRRQQSDPWRRLNSQLRIDVGGEGGEGGGADPFSDQMSVFQQMLQD